MKKRRVSITISEEFGRKLDEIAGEIHLTRTATLRVLIFSWKGTYNEDLKNQINRSTNLLVVLTSLVSGLIKESKGNDVFYQLKNEADKSLRSFKESGKLTM